MKPKERLFTAFDLGKPDHVPACIFGGGMWVFRNTGYGFQDLIGKPREMADAYLRANELVHWPIIYVGSGYNNLHLGALGGKIKYRRVGAPDLEEPLVGETADELDGLDIEALGRDVVIQTIWEATERVVKVAGDEYAVTMTAWGPFTLAAQLYGVEKLMRATYKAPQEVDKVVDFAARMILRFYQPLVDRGMIGMVSIADPAASGDLVSRKHFGRFALKPLQLVTSALRAKNVRSLLHICGNTTDKLDLLVETGADCISVDQKVTLATAKEIFAHKRVCLAGNVHPVQVLNEGTPEKVREECEKALAVGFPGGGYVLMPGCDIPPTVPLENVQVFMKTAETWRYS
ncbi:MAG: uroporphyrinogen decarboxylase family protein [Chloroflexi bacterium]|nr:uroporphyrinogen decarboxylase family protein [Chloroflexota bacterium]